MVNAQKIDTSLTLPDGFSAYIFADNLGRARHITVDDKGDVYVALRELKNNKGIVALRDENDDNRADRVEYFFDEPGTGISWQDDYLYFSPNTAVYRFKFSGTELVPDGSPDKIVKNLKDQSQHGAKSFTLDKRGNLYLNIGAPSNACQKE